MNDNQKNFLNELHKELMKAHSEVNEPNIRNNLLENSNYYTYIRRYCK